jgi:hypothetical protein
MAVKTGKIAVLGAKKYHVFVMDKHIVCAKIAKTP